MTFNNAIHYIDNTLHVEAIALTELAERSDTPTYIYSRARLLENYQKIYDAFQHLNIHIHYSAKANANLTLLRTLIEVGAGVDCVSGGEIFLALKAGADPAHIVFAGVGKTAHDMRYALEQNIGWFNVENEAELQLLNDIAGSLGQENIKVALRLNPEVTANTHPHIATGHGAAKFGLTAETVQRLFANPTDYPNLTFTGLHLHIGSQLGDVNGTVAAIEKASELLTPFPQLRTLNIGGGIPAHYLADQHLPSAQDFAQALTPLLREYEVLLEPGRSIVADAGLLLTQVLYVKEQGGQRFVIVDAGMTELMRPALYNATHEIVPVRRSEGKLTPAQVVGPVCETTDVLGRDVLLPDVQAGDLLAILTAGAYGMVMASTYNARPRPAEVWVEGEKAVIVRQRETWDDLLLGLTEV